MVAKTVQRSTKRLCQRVLAAEDNGRTKRHASTTSIYSVGSGGGDRNRNQYQNTSYFVYQAITSLTPRPTIVRIRLCSVRHVRTPPC